MARCSGCGGEINAATRFCPHCGRSLTMPGSAVSGPAAASGLSDAPGPSGGTDGKKKVALAAAAGLAVVALAGFALLKATGVLSAEKPTSPAVGVLNAPAVQTAQAPVLTPPIPSAPQNPVMTPPTPQTPKKAENPMPEDVVAYLRWLKQFEAARRNLEYKGMAEMTIFTQKATTGAIESFMNMDPNGEPAPVKPEDNPVAGVARVIQDWNRAAQLFQQRRPPNPCATLAGHYNQALVAGVAQMSALHGMLSGALASIQGAGGQATPMSKDALTDLYRQKSSREGSVNVDAAYGSANEALNNLRAQYTSLPEDVRTFDIKAADGGGMKLPFMGM